jgi:hypothetical protein
MALIYLRKCIHINFAIFAITLPSINKSIRVKKWCQQTHVWLYFGCGQLGQGSAIITMLSRIYDIHLYYLLVR